MAFQNMHVTPNSKCKNIAIIPEKKREKKIIKLLKISVLIEIIRFFFIQFLLTKLFFWYELIEMSISPIQIGGKRVEAK